MVFRLNAVVFKLFFEYRFVSINLGINLQILGFGAWIKNVKSEILRFYQSLLFFLCGKFSTFQRIQS
jgi:hypothetical protein